MARFRLDPDEAKRQNLTFCEDTSINVVVIRFRDYARLAMTKSSVNVYTSSLRSLLRPVLNQPLQALLGAEGGDRFRALVQSCVEEYSGAVAGKARAAYNHLQVWVNSAGRVQLPAWPKDIKIDYSTASRPRKRSAPPRGRTPAPEIPDEVALAANDIHLSAPRGALPLDHLLDLRWVQIRRVEHDGEVYIKIPTAYGRDNLLFSQGSQVQRALAVLWQHAGGADFVDTCKGECALLARAPGDPRAASLYRLRIAIRRALKATGDIVATGAAAPKEVVDGGSIEVQNET